MTCQDDVPWRVRSKAEGEKPKCPICRNLSKDSRAGNLYQHFYGLRPCGDPACKPRMSHLCIISRNRHCIYATLLHLVTSQRAARRLKHDFGAYMRRSFGIDTPPAIQNQLDRKTPHVRHAGQFHGISEHSPPPLSTQKKFACLLFLSQRRTTSFDSGHVCGCMRPSRVPATYGIIALVSNDFKRLGIHRLRLRPACH